jgi:hypothetical protein
MDLGVLQACMRAWRTQLAIVDAGALEHYLAFKDVGVLSDLQPTQEALTARLADGTTIQSISEVFLSLLTIPYENDAHMSFRPCIDLYYYLLHPYAIMVA